MPDRDQLPFLLRLIDDDSEIVREKVMQELESFGASLELEIAKLAEPPDSVQQRLLHDLIMDNRKKVLREKWQTWYNLRDDKLKLETAFHLIAEYMNGPAYPAKVADLLDMLAAEYRALHDDVNPMTLAQFLFDAKGLKGAASDYYNPRNSDLVYVMQSKRGLPITLACVFILVGSRLDLEIEGCNVPGHFFAVVMIDNQKFMVDCFNGGQFFLSDEFIPAHVTQHFDVNRLLTIPPTAELIIKRVLMNLIRAYQGENNSGESKFFSRLLTELNNYSLF